ncbi:hypothetical protein Efla_003667 [Eimeria flavescens]
MIPRNLDELRRHMAYSQRSESAFHDETSLQSLAFTNTSAGIADEQDGGIGRMGPHAVYEHPTFTQPPPREWPSSQSHLKQHDRRISEQQPPRQGGFQDQQSQSQSQAFSQQPAMAFRSRSSAEHARMFRSSQPDPLPRFLPYSTNDNGEMQQDLPQQLSACTVVPQADRDCSREAKMANHEATNKPRIQSFCSSQNMSAATGAPRIPQALSQSCSTQAETVASTQRATSCGPPKVSSSDLPKGSLCANSEAGSEEEDAAAVHEIRRSREARRLSQEAHQPSGAYCSSNRIYRKPEAIRKHMESNACKWTADSQTQNQVLPARNSDSASSPQQQTAGCSLGGSTGQESCLPLHFNSQFASQPLPPFKSRPMDPQFASETQLDVRASRQLVAVQSGSALEANALAAQLISRKEGLPPGAAPALPNQRNHANRPGSSWLQESMPLQNSAREQQNSPLSSGVSTCLEELPLEQLLGRLSDKDVQRDVGDPSKTQRSPLQPAAKPDSAVQPPPNSLLRCPEEALALAAFQESCEPVKESCPTLLSNGVSAAASNSLVQRTSPQSHKEAKPQPAAAKAGAPRAQPSQRSCAVQTQLKMSYPRNKSKKRLCREQRVKLEGAAPKRRGAKGQEGGKKEPEQAAKVLPRPATTTTKRCTSISKKISQKREAKSREVKSEFPKKQSQRLSCLHQDKKEEAEVLRQQSMEFPLLLVGAHFHIKEKQSACWESCIIGEYYPSTRRHEVTLASSAQKKLHRFLLSSGTRTLVSNSAPSHVELPKIGSLPTDGSEQRRNLERRLQAQLKDGSRSRDVKRLADPLVKHLLRVAGNPSYRDTRQSIIVTGKTLICELLRRFPCRRLVARRQGLDALKSHFFSGDSLTRTGCGMRLDNSTKQQCQQPADGDGDRGRPVTTSLTTFDVETHFVSNRILRKVAGLHSYDDGCIAEMRMPEQRADLGNIRLLLCLGRLPQTFGQSNTKDAFSASAPNPMESGAAGTLLRTAAALQWQGVWILPSCPDIFNPLAIRASQGALFWLPFRRGSFEELVALCRAKDLAICVPDSSGIPVTTAGIFETKKGVCLVLDTRIMNSVGNGGVQKVTRAEARYSDKNAVSDVRGHASPRKAIPDVCKFKPDVSLSLGDVAPESSMELLHPISVASLLLYNVKQKHFPALHGSPFVFSRGHRL